MISLTKTEKMWNCLFFLPCYFIFGQLLFSLLFMLVVMVTNTNIETAKMDAMFNLVYMITMAIFAVILFFPYLKKSLEYMKGRWLKETLYACTKGTILFYFANILSSLLILLLNPNSSSANQDAIIELASSAPVIMVITTVFVAPFLEEMVFRVGIFQMFYDKNPMLAYLLSSLAFGFVHIMSGLFGGDLTQILYIVPYSLLGFVLCHMYEKRDSIFVPMLVHAINNAIAMIAII